MPELSEKGVVWFFLSSGRQVLSRFLKIPRKFKQIVLQLLLFLFINRLCFFTFWFRMSAFFSYELPGLNGVVFSMDLPTVCGPSSV